MDASHYFTSITHFPYRFSIMKEIKHQANQAGIMLSVQQMIPNPAKLNAKKEYLFIHWKMCNITMWNGREIFCILRQGSITIAVILPNKN